MRHSSVVVLFAAALLAACSKTQPAAEPVRAVRTLTVAADSAAAEHAYAGEVRARTETRLGFRVGGKLAQRQVNLGDSVKRGQVLAQIDAQDLKLGQDAARAALQAAQVTLDQAQADFRRFKDLRDQGFISAAELDRRETTLKSAQAQADQARAQAGVQRNQATYASLVADAAGVITAVEADPGAVLAAGTPVVRLAHDGPRDVVFSVPEDKVSEVRSLIGKAGALTVSFWGDGAGTVSASVREVAAAADPTTRTFVVKADVGNARVGLGQTASVSVDAPKVAGVIKLPLSAVVEQHGKTSVWLVDKATMTVKAQPVRVSGAERNSLVVAEGLHPGQIVVTAGVHALSQGQKVKLFGEAPAVVAAAR